MTWTFVMSSVISGGQGQMVVLCQQSMAQLFFFFKHQLDYVKM